MLTTHTRTPSRVLAATLAIGALSVPAASARPIDQNPPVGDAVTLGHQVTDLRSADAREAARLHAWSELGGSKRVQDLRHLEAGNGATANLADSASAARAKAQANYYASYGHPSTIHRVVSSDDGTPWVIIAGSLAGVCLLLGGSAAIAGRRPRSQTRTPRVAI